jgi:hypothetical protein
MRRQCSELKYTVPLYHNVKNIFYIFKDGTLYSLNVTTKLTQFEDCLRYICN